jgi:hypothetical protein
MPVPDGAVRLLAADDYNKKNVRDDNLVGWRSTSVGEGGIFNPIAYAVLRVVVSKIVKGELQELYDQPMMVQNTGAVVVPFLNERVGMIKSFRFTGPRIMQADPNYVARVDEQEQWDELLKMLGKWRWELPRGIPPSKVKPEEGKTFTTEQELAVATAKLESFAEAGFELVDRECVSQLVIDPSFYAHPQYVVRGRVKSITGPTPDDLEIIRGSRFFTPAEVRSMVSQQVLIEDVGFDDGISKAALADTGFHY